MFRIGVISDTHNYLDPEVLKLFEGVDHILHGGDIGMPWLIMELETIAPVTAVLGNTDQAGLRFRETEVVELDQHKFLVHHIVNPNALEGGEIAAVWGWRHAFIWTGAPGLVLALVLLPFADQPRGQAELKPGESLPKPKLRDYLALIKNGRYQLLIWGYVAYTFAMGAFAFWGPTFLETVHHLAAPKPDRFFGGVIVFGGLVGTLLGGFTASAWQKRTPAGYAWLLALSTLLAVPIAFAALRSASAQGAMTFLAVTIFLLFLSTGPVNTLILESVPPNLRASAMALSIFMIHLFGDVWSPEIVGRAADAFHDLQKGVLILPVMLLIGGLFWLTLALNINKRKLEKV